MKGDLTLAAFLLARLDEDEQDAAAATPGPWRAAEPGETTSPVLAYPEPSTDVVAAGGSVAADNEGFGACSVPDARHIARHDPTTVLADVAARRRLVEPHVHVHRCEYGDYAGGEAGECTAQVLRLLAVRYAGHPDHYSGWGPT